MKFDIHTQEYERLGGTTEYGTIPLKGKDNNRNFFIDKDAAPLLDLSDGTYDFEKEFGGLSEKQQHNILDGLRVLSAFGGARVIKEENRDPSGFIFRVAGEKDYKEASALLTDDNARRFGTLFGEKDDLSEDDIRFRQFNNQEYLFLCLKNKKPVGVIVTVMPDPYSYAASFRISGAVLSGSLSEGETGAVLKGLLHKVKSAFESEFRICRYLQYEDGDKWLPYLKDEGFKKVAFLEKETAAGGDVTVYDLRFEGEE